MRLPFPVYFNEMIDLPLEFVWLRRLYVVVCAEEWIEYILANMRLQQQLVTLNFNFRLRLSAALLGLPMY